MFPVVFNVVIIILAIFTIFHLWKYPICSKTWRIILTIVLLFVSWIGVIFYWIYYFSIRRRDSSISKNNDDSSLDNEEVFIKNELAKIYAQEDMALDKRMDEMAKVVAQHVLVTTFSVEQKCRLLEKVNAYTKQLEAPLHNYLHFMSIYYSYNVINNMLGSPILQEEKSQFIQKFNNDELTDFRRSYQSIMGIMGSIAKKGKTFEMSSAMLDGYDIPTYRR